jgi:hypothetical protein
MNMTTATKNTAKKTNDAGAEQLKALQAQATDFFGMLAEAGKLAISNTIELDKMILNRVTDSAQEAFDHGRAVLAAKDVKTAFEMQTAYVQNSLEKGVCDTKEVMEFAKVKATEVTEQFKKQAA